MMRPWWVVAVMCVAGMVAEMVYSAEPPVGPSVETSAGWVKHENNPVLGGELGTCFDVSLLRDEVSERYRMWFSWRPQQSIALTESDDGIHWSVPRIVLAPAKNDWEQDLNRPGVLKKDGVFYMWYTGQADGESRIGLATSTDGVCWERRSGHPVMEPELPWEKVAVMCPHVEWDGETGIFRMWYSAGEQYEPNAIGYATSPDGMAWTKYPAPVFVADPDSVWEQHKVTAAQIFRHDGWFLMFYIGFENEDLARIGIARSRDGISRWERHPANPIISPGHDCWDQNACYKPYVLYDAAEQKWRLWYNGRSGEAEQIGFATHDGEDLGFPTK